MLLPDAQQPLWPAFSVLLVLLLVQPSSCSSLWIFSLKQPCGAGGARLPNPVGLLPGGPCSLPQPLVCSSIACLSTLPCFGFRGSQADGDGFHDTFRFLVCSCEAQLRPFLLAFLKVFLYLLISLFKKFLINLKRVYENVAGCRDDQWLRAHAALTEDPFGAEYNHL